MSATIKTQTKSKTNFMRNLFFVKNVPLLLVLLAVQSCAQCTRQHDPSRDRRIFEQERKWANRPTQKLDAKGEIPPPAPEPGSEPEGSPADVKFAALCASCHGDTGKADGAAAASMNPKPRNLTEGAWQEKTADDRIYNVIKNGGASVGLSANMAAWGTVLQDDEIRLLIMKIRSLKGK